MTPQAQLQVNARDAAHVPEYVTLQGTINRIVFHNPENGYCVISVTMKEQTVSPIDGVTEEWYAELKMTGHLAAPREGDEYRFTGTFTTHPKFGRQLKFTDAELLLPIGKSGIARYLSQITYGIGVAKAEKIVAALGEDALSQIRENPAALNHESLSFLTDIQKEEITADLTKNSVQAELAALICSPGIGMGTVHKILNTLGSDALQTVKENPYMLCDEVFGIGFKLADAIALKVGIPKNSPLRVDAALNFVLKEAAGEGHCFLTPALIVEALLGTVDAERLMGRRIRGPREKKKEGIIAYSVVGIEEIKEANQRIIDQGKCVREGDCVYGKELWLAEIIVAERVKTLISQEPKEIAGMDLMIKDLEERDNLEYAPEQKESVARALQSPLSIITGGPGTGKTTVVNAIVEIYERLYHIKGHRVYLAAPTGRAAKRMTEATGHEAMTIHRLLGYNPNGGGDGFTYGIDEPLPGPGLIIVDEMSMTDIELTSKLFAAMEIADDHKMHQVVLVGDANQLPSVGAGSVLRDLIASGKVPTTQLQYNYRQANGSKIAEYAHFVCKGEMPQLKSAGDFEFVQADGGDDAAGTINFLAETYINAKGLGPLDWIVLTPMKRNSCGVKALNQSLREIINPVTLNPDKTKTLGNYRLNDRVMVIRNNYQLGVFNGDVGIVTDIAGGNLTVDFGDSEVEFAFEHLELLTLAYAITIHKAQGSEFELVILAVTSQHYIMLTREIFYTGLTRACKKMVLVGDPKSVAMCVKNKKTSDRYSRLAERVKDGN